MPDQNAFRVIGLMSGTSLDGVDLCEVQFFNNDNQWDYQILKTCTVAYDNSWKTDLQNAHLRSTKELNVLDEKYCKLLSQYILGFMNQPDDIDMVCSHGHTVWHQPEKGLTYQIGNLKVLSKLINKTLVCDFRTADVALGGQGAPLVPIGDKLLFSEYDYCINIGGFVNISYQVGNKRLAFDICPANKVLNLFAEKMGIDYDDKGLIASKGLCDEDLLNQLNALKFYSQKPPKSLGVEWLDNEMLPILKKYDLPIPDMLNTLCQHIAHQISKSLQKPNAKILITGGGAYHQYLIKCIKDNNPQAQIHIPKNELIDYKEALIFGLLGILKFRDEINVLKSVTGAKHDHSSGKVFEV